jgi:hypothetical protein
VHRRQHRQPVGVQGGGRQVAKWIIRRTLSARSYAILCVNKKMSGWTGWVGKDERI